MCTTSTENLDKYKTTLWPGIRKDSLKKKGQNCRGKEW